MFGKMFKKSIPFLACVIPLLAGGRLVAQDAPAEVPICDLASNPLSFDGKLIRLRGTLSVNFEDFSLDTSNCNPDQGIWLAFGGDVPGIVPSTANDSSRKPGADINVRGVAYQIKKDDSFRRLYALITARDGDEPAYHVTTTLTGAFFGEQIELPGGRHYVGGYGHLGCCALLVITEVSGVDSVPAADLNVRGTVRGPDGRPMRGFVVYDDTIGGIPPERQQTATNERGEFSFSNSGEVLRFEDPRYRPVALPVKPGGASVLVRLEPAQRSDWVVFPCPQGNAASRVGFSVTFSLPPTMDSDLLSEADLPFQLQFVFPQGGSPSEAELIITNDPDEAAVHSSSVATHAQGGPQQRWIKNGAGTVIGIDSRVELRHGSVYPNGGFFRESRFWDHDIASYTVERNELPGTLDRIIDSACIAKW